MDEFPDPDEEFDLVYGDEMDMVLQMDDDFPPVSSPIKKSKRSLEFSRDNEEHQTMSPKPLQKSPLVNQNKENNIPKHSNTIIDLTENNIPKQSNTIIDLTENNLKSRQLFTSQLNSEVQFKTQQDQLSLSVNNKRMFDDVDLDDLDFDDDFNSALKKSKSNDDKYMSLEEQQKRTINKILEMRKESQINLRSGLSKQNFSRTLLKNKSIGISRVFPKWNFVKGVDKEGIGVYIRLTSEDDFFEKGSSLSKQYCKGNILSEPFESLLDVARTLNVAKQEFIKKKEEAVINNEGITSDDFMIIDNDKTHELWVEKYKPRNYRQLLSDEGTNRTLLQWLKLWDKIVFHKDIPKHLTQNEEQKFHKKGKDFFFKKKINVLNQDLDETGCPVHKVALLCGPPGLGKTTLAHIVAKHAGYNVVEINASDDRSPALFQSTLDAATQMRSVISQDPKPNCLILDEIDGAPQASIEVLVRYITGKGPNNKKKQKDGSKKDSTNLKRPIICICNDIYVPALRPLRQIAFVLQFPPTSSARLAARLMEVSKYENITTDLSAMIALSEKTSNDIRSCLSALSCYQNQTVRLSAIHNANIGVKDMQKPLFSMWQDIFQIQDNKKTVLPGLSKYDPKEDATTRRLKVILHSVQAMGEYDRLAQGVFENYLNVKVNSDMYSLSEGLEWFCSFDMINHHIMKTQDYRMYPYLAYPFVTWHIKFATRAWPKISYPSVDYEASQRKLKCTQIVQDVLKGMSVQVKGYNQNETFILDTAPLITYMLAPPLRPISSALFTPAEKIHLAHLVDTMIDYNLNYVQVRQEDGTYVFLLDPNIELVSKISDLKTPELSYACKQMVSHEISIVKMTRLEAKLYSNSSNTGSSSQTMSIEPPPISSSSLTPKASKSLPNHLQRLTPQSVKKPIVVDTVTKDFFGRVVENQNIDNSKMKTDDIVKTDIWFHFKEGYNNAVRKNMLMKELL